MDILRYNNQFSLGLISLSSQIGNRFHKIQKALYYLKLNGFRVKLGKTVFPEKYTGYKSASIVERVDDLHNLFTDAEVNLILNTGGGYNSNEILEFLDYELIKNKLKYFGK